jgi:hypothetical protein
MQQCLEMLTPEQRGRVAPLMAQFCRGMERQHRRDVETFRSLVRVLTNPGRLVQKDGGGRTEVDMFADWVRAIVAQELNNKGNL